jgi:hypothetical protein
MADGGRGKMGSGWVEGKEYQLRWGIGLELTCLFTDGLCGGGVESARGNGKG